MFQFLNIFSHCHNFNIFARLQDSGIWHQMMVRCKLKHFLSWSSPVTSWKLYIEDQGHFQHIIELREDTMHNLNTYIVPTPFFQKRNGSIPYGDHQCSELKSVFSKKQHKCVQMKEYYIKTQLQVSRKEIKPLCFTLVTTAS